MTKIVRNDLVQEIPFATLWPKVAPMITQNLYAGVVNVQRYVKPGTVQVDRQMGGKIDAELENAENITYTASEKRKRKIVDERKYANYPNKDACELAVARAAQIGVHSKIESAVSALFSELVPVSIPENTTLCSVLRAKILELRKMTNRKIWLLGSLSAISAMLDDLSIIDAMRKPASASIIVGTTGAELANNQASFEIQLQLLASALGASETLIGGNEWDEKEVYLMVAPTPGMDATEDVQAFATIVQIIDGETGETLEVSTDYLTEYAVDIIDAVMRVAPIVCNAELAAAVNLASMASAS